MATYTNNEQYAMEQDASFGMAEIGAWMGSSYLKERYGTEALSRIPGTRILPGRGLPGGTLSRWQQHGYKGRFLRMAPEQFVERYGTTGATALVRAQGHRRMAAALKIAGKRGYGVTTAAGWRAATRAGIQSQFAKVAIGKAATLGFNVLMAGWQLELAYSAVKSGVGVLRAAGRKSRRLEMGTPLMGTEAAYTERQRALRAITSSRMSTRAALGNEAA